MFTETICNEIDQWQIKMIIFVPWICDVVMDCGTISGPE